MGTLEVGGELVRPGQTEALPVGWVDSQYTIRQV